MQRRKVWPGSIWLLMGISFLVHLVLSAITEGYSVDVGCFTAWSTRLTEVGPAEFYTPEYFADYPPGYMLVLWCIGLIASGLNISLNTPVGYILLTLVPTVCDVALGYLVYRIGCRYLGESRALRLSAMALFCPPLLYDTAIWKQVDGVFALCIVASFWMLCRKRWWAAAGLFGLALSVKPQALLFGPVFALCYLMEIAGLKTVEQKLRQLGKAAGCALVSLSVVVVTALPFWGNQPLNWLWEKYTGTMNSYPYASLNAFNLWALLGGNWAQQTNGIWPGGPSWQLMGTIGILAATVFVSLLAFVAWRHQRFSPLLLGALYTTLVYCLGHRMHERYLIPTLLMMLAACARIGDKRLLGAFALMSGANIMNLAMVLASNGTEDQFLTSAVAVAGIRILSVMHLVGAGILVWASVRICTGKELCQYGISAWVANPEPRSAKIPAWSLREAGALALLTLAVSGVSLWDLGDTKAPQTVQAAQGSSYTATVELAQPATTVWVYPEINWQGTLRIWDGAGQLVLEQTLDYSNVFQWKALSIPAGQQYTIQLDNASVLELAFRDSQGRLIQAQGETGFLMDEAHLVPETISYRNSMYFDEIYHARTAYEHLHGMPVYETTHPPLGKVFLMMGIWLFGMTGFGWRIAGVVFGIALVVVMYLFVRRITRKPSLALFAAVLTALDSIRLSQSRLATIDVYSSFFILLGAYFMVWYAQSVLEKGVCKSILPMALCGLAFGLGAASKWTGIYAGAGLCVVYFWALYQRWRQKQPGFGKELATALAGGVAFFVLVPLVVYGLSYLPYFWRQEGFSLSQWWQCQVTMFEYHSQLKSTHPFESRWYSWPFDLRPVWYYSGQVAMGFKATIAGLGNPVVWWAGAVAIGAVIWRQMSGRANGAQAAVLVFYFTQLLPWVLVSRCTFQYHYLPSLWFAISAIAVTVGRMEQTSPKKAAWVRGALVVLAAVVFVWFYPVASGMTVPTEWVESTQWLSSWSY